MPKPSAFLQAGECRDRQEETLDRVLECLECVVAVDTSVVHLAGAMGKAAWVMLPHAADWRWLLDRTDSPWYPSLRLFRQGPDRSWDTVIGAIAKEITAPSRPRRSTRPREDHL